ncbi:MAG: hypothetical protein KC621_11590, partial [Myxococcales bacterium]|nr:hypothetical protein [Myxococcales bacterium]
MWLWFTATALAQAVPWPADTAWRPTTIQGGAINDPTGDQNGQYIYDIVGEPGAPAVFQYVDATWMMVRVRLADTPQVSQTDWANFAFFDYHEQDGDRSNGTWDTVIFLDGKTSQVTTPIRTIPTPTTTGSRTATRSTSAPIPTTPTPTATGSPTATRSPTAPIPS